MGSKIVLAEDDEGMGIMILALLENAGYEIKREPTGVHAWDTIRDELPDLVILDWNMPGLSGLDVLKKMRENQETEKIPVIFLTANRDEMDARMAMVYKIEAYLQKPFHPNDLLENVRKIFNV
jgi:two-component system phosphate regulon response regulator PhoB